MHRLILASLLVAAWLLPGVARAQSLTDAQRQTLDTLRLEFLRDGVTASPERIAENYAAACRAGHVPACHAADWRVDTVPKLELAAKALEPACTSGDQVACLVVAWHKITTPPGEGADLVIRGAARQMRDLCDGGLQAACWEYGKSLYSVAAVAADPRSALPRWRKACDAGELGACLSLGEAYRTGTKGMAPDAKKATELRKKACDGGYLNACYLDFTLSTALTDAVAAFGGLCDHGHYDACRQIYADAVADMPFDGVLFPYVERGCTLGDGDACVRVAAKELDAGEAGKAAHTYTRACALGSSDGCVGEVKLIMVSKAAGSPRTAYAAYEMACLSGDVPEACTELAVALRSGVDMPADPQKARALLARACVGPESPARTCAELGKDYENGLGGERDRTLASQYYRWGCSGGDVDSCVRRGFLLHEGVGVRRDDAEALASWQIGCDRGRTDACFEAAKVLDEATTVPRDVARAATLYDLACAGQPPLGGACSGLGRLREEGQDYAAARTAYESAVALNDVEGERRLARLLWRGLGGPKRHGRAKQLSEEACQSGDAAACRGPAFL